MPVPGRASVLLRCLAFLGLLSGALAPAARAQSLTGGALDGRVIGTGGEGVAQARVTLTDQASGAILELEADPLGRFQFRFLDPGSYSLRAEQGGYEPVVQPGLVILGGERHYLVLRMRPAPPPVRTVDRLPPLPGGALPQTMNGGNYLTHRAVSAFSARQDLAELSHDLSTTVFPDDRAGWTLAGGGLPPRYSTIALDALPQSGLRHPGVPGEPSLLPALPPERLGSVAVLDHAVDAEWGGAPGQVIAATSLRGSPRLSVTPWVTYSGSSLGGRSLDNPADSSALSLQAGAVVRGPLGQRGKFVLGGNYQTLEQPTADPWTRDTSSFNGAGVPFVQTLRQIATDSFARPLLVYSTPVLRTFRGGAGFGRGDFDLGARHHLVIQGGFARWKEQRPLLGEDLSSGAASLLEARDLDLSAALTSTLSQAYGNEFRVGLRTARRDWTSGAIPFTSLVADDAAFGQSPVLPALFDQRGVDVSEAVHYEAGRHHLKLGGQLRFSRWQEDYLFARDGQFAFGSLDQFGMATGTFFQIRGPDRTVQFNTSDIGFSLEDLWRLRPGFQLLLGVRYDDQKLTTGLLPADSAWLNASGLRPNQNPQDRHQFAPRAGFIWNAGARGEWVVRGGFGLEYGGMDPAAYAEAIRYDGTVDVRRGIGAFAGWPAAPDSAAAPSVGPRLAIFSREYRNPRSMKADVGVSRAVWRGLGLGVRGAYHHTDYLLRRSDLNLLPAPTGYTQEGRPVYGALVQQGGLLAAVPGSNRRIPGFDLVSGFAPTGFSDYYAVSASVSGDLGRGVSLDASYTWSRTSDNTPLGRSGDPADQFSPFPQDAAGSEWVDGRSDLDVPHRAAVLLQYRSPGPLGLELGARYRFRSGLPFTPGFQPGVDANGDGSGRNDPAFVDASLPGMGPLISAHSCLGSQTGGFAGRNSCRDPAVHALDLELALRLPLGRRAARLSLDAFNVVASAAGLRDHALVLVDPAGTLTTDAGGNVTLPLVTNPHFGELLSRRTLPRVVRFGLSLDY